MTMSDFDLDHGFDESDDEGPAAPARQVLAIREKHSYVGSYAHLDPWHEIGSAEILSRGAEPTDLDESCEPTDIYMLLRVTLNAGAVGLDDQPVGDAEIARAIKDSFSRAGCAHEWDCCGCVSTYVNEVAKLPNGLWYVQSHASRNY